MQITVVYGPQKVLLILKFELRANDRQKWLLLPPWLHENLAIKANKVTVVSTRYTKRYGVVKRRPRLKLYSTFSFTIEGSGLLKTR